MQVSWRKVASQVGRHSFVRGGCCSSDQWTHPGHLLPPLRFTKKNRRSQSFFQNLCGVGGAHSLSHQTLASMWRRWFPHLFMPPLPQIYSQLCLANAHSYVVVVKTWKSDPFRCFEDWSKRQDWCTLHEDRFYWWPLRLVFPSRWRRRFSDTVVSHVDCHCAPKVFGLGSHGCHLAGTGLALLFHCYS